ncbi:MAG: GspE/PulE family protein [Verrucomicrobiota bacterium]|jgi:type IV pilus assembly protein PilB|nr:GspE/PulE family protein [Verrucomicrobiota bacterium]
MSQPLLDLSVVRIDPAQAHRLPRHLAIRRLLLPLADIQGTLHLACAQPPDEATRAHLKRHLQRDRLEFHLVEGAALRRALLQVYGHGADGAAAGDAAAAEDPVARADEIFRAARLRHASDIHLDPERHGLRIRFRVDGVLEDYKHLPPKEQAPLISRIKVLAGMDIAERRAPQDGGFSLPPLPEEPLTATDVRVATLPVRHGERATLRLLSCERETLSLENLGMYPEHLAAVEQLLDRPHGLFLLTGPTGSGKSTTLYAAIRRLLQHEGLNILTVEDPIEYEMAGVGQAEVDSADKVSFTKALRSLLRHDPDVIMIGEIRDETSLDTAVKAALTGHLVLSTLHTNSALGAITRLSDMGLAPHLIAATLRISIAQRLVRRLCPHCRRAVTLSEWDAALLGHPELAGRTAYEPGGCLACAGRGYNGRTALFEVLAPDADLASQIARRVEETALAAELSQKGYRTLGDDAVRKILDGIISPEDARREL